MKTLLFHNYKVFRGEREFLSVDTHSDHIRIHAGLNLLVAPNGYGKSTILQAMSGNFNSISGSIQIENDPRSIAESSLYISEYLAFPKYIYPKEWIEFVIQKKIDDAALLNLAKRFHFEQKLNSYLGRMSQGERRKVTWMCAYFSDKKILFMDEPLDGLDLLAIPVVKEIIAEWNQNQKTVLMITHQPHDVLSLTRDILFIKNKKFVSVKNELKNALDFEPVVRKYYT